LRRDHHRRKGSSPDRYAAHGALVDASPAHSRQGNDCDLVGRHFIALNKAALCPLRPSNEPTRGPEAVAVQPPFQASSHAALLVLIECAQLVILTWSGIERNDAGDLTEQRWARMAGTCVWKNSASSLVCRFMRATFPYARTPARTVQYFGRQGSSRQVP